MNKEERKELMQQLFKENEQKEYNCRNCEYSQDIKHFTSNCKLHYGGVLNSDAKHCMYYTGLDANEDIISENTSSFVATGDISFLN